MNYAMSFPIMYFPDPTQFGTVGLGKLYVGVENGNPYSTPSDRIQVYVAQQVGPDLPINQPIDISAGGVPLYNGSPATLTTATGFSVDIRDYLGSLVYYSPSGGDTIQSLNDLTDDVAGLQDDFSGLPKTLDKFSDLSATPAVLLRMVNIKRHTSGTVGGGQFIAVSSVGLTPDGGTISVSATAGIYWQRTLSGFVTPEMFGAIGVIIGASLIANDTAFTNLINYLNADPIVKRVLIPPRNYGISTQLPAINVSNVQLIGAGHLSNHDGGSIPNSSRLTWIGGSSASTMLRAYPISGASNGRMDSLEITGLTIDCASLLANGFEGRSFRNSNIGISVFNGTGTNVYIGVVATLAESTDTRDNRFNILTRNVDGAGAGGVGLICDGSATANTCFNFFERIVCIGKNAIPIQLWNVDNNLWALTSAAIVSGGTAPYGVEFRGTNTAGFARSETFMRFSASSVVRGAGLVAPAKNIKIYALDTENGAPNPVIEAGATCYYQYDKSPMYPELWVNFTPVVTSNTGAIASYTCQFRYMRVPGGVNWKCYISITNNGTGAGFLLVTLPFTAATQIASVATGYEGSTGAFGVRGVINSGGTQLLIAKADGTYPVATGYNLSLSGFYEVVD